MMRRLANKVCLVETADDWFMGSSTTSAQKSEHYETKNWHTDRKRYFAVAIRRAAEERRPLSDLFRDALVQYLRKEAATPNERKMAYHLFCDLFEEDMWDP
jgi:hypothetical protein